MKYKLQDLIDMEHFQNLQDRLNDIYSFPSSIIDNDGNILTATAWQDICMKFHRKNKECENLCIKSDQYIKDHIHKADPTVTYRCPHGLVENATPIIIDGVHYGNFFTGQFFLEEPDLNFFKAQAHKYGFDEKVYLEAVKKVPIWNQKQLDSYLLFIKGLIVVLSESGLKRLKEIEKSQDLYQSILRTAMDGYCLTDIKGRLLEVNDAYCQMSGYSENELLTMCITDLEASENSEDMVRHMENNSPIAHSQEQISKLTIFHDITDHKLAEMALQQSEKRYRDHFSQFPAPTFVWKFDGHGFVLSEYNLAAETITEGRVRDIKGVYADKLYADADSQHILKSLERCFKENRSIQKEFEYRLVTTGKKKWIKGTWVYIAPDTVVLHAEDITERKQAIIALQESKNRYESIYNNAQVGLGRTRIRDGKILECNKKMALMFGYEDTQTFIDEYIFSENFVEKNFRERFVKKLKANVSLSDLEAQFYRKDGEKIWIRFDSRIFLEQGYMEDVMIDITKQKRLESEKEAEHKELISIFDGMDEVIYVSDPETYELLYSNEAFNKNWGKRIHDQCHLVLQKRDTPCPFCTNHLIFGKNIGTSHIWEFQNEVTKRWYHCTDRALKWPDGRMVRLEIATDINEQKEAQINLKKTKDRLESLWSLTKIADADKKTLFDHVTEEIKRITESEYAFYGFLSDDEKTMDLYAWSKDTMKDCEVTDQTLHFPIDKAGIWAKSVRKKQIITINDFQQDLPNKKGVPDGHVPLTRMMAVPYEIDNKIVSIATVANKKTEYTPEDEAQVQSFLGNAQILIERKNNEEILNFQQKTITLNNKIANVFLTSSEDDIFADVLDVILETLQSPFGYFGFIDNDGNLSCPSMTRNIWDKCDMPDKSIVFPKEIWGGLWGESLKKVKTIISNQGLRLPEGHIQLKSAMAVPIIHHDELIGQFVIGNKEGGYSHYEKFLLESASSQTAPILNNLLEKEIQEKEHRKMQARIEQAQKMESVGNLAGGIAHDFNNLLFPIIGMSELMLEDLEPDSLVYENAQEIYRAGNRAKGLVSQILSFSRQTEHEMMPVKLQKILKEVLKLCRSSIPTNIEIEQKIQQDCGSIWANTTNLHQIAMNLITNAYHAVQDKNGKITVALKEIILEKNELFILFVSPGKYAVLSVSDNGSGMTEEIKSKIFEPYFTTKEKGKGTGLGLAVVYGIVKEFGGDIQVYSEVGSGTTFNIYLPLMKKNAAVETRSLKSEIQTGDEHILLVDDEPSITQLIQLMLERLGYTVTTRVSSIEALEVFKKNTGKFDIIISDMSMPNMTGDQLAHEIRQIRPEIPIIICTGFSERINKENAEALGANGLLMKPIVKSEMAKMIRKMLDEAKIYKGN